MFISGGRNVEGQILSDVWSLSVAAEISPPPLCHSAATAPSAADMVEPSKEAATTATIVSSAPVLVWRRCVELELPTPRCAHGAAIVTCDIDAFASEVPDPTTMKEPAEAEAVTVENQTAVPSDVSTTAVSSMLLIGGFTGAGISGDAIVHPLLCSTTAITSQPAPVSAQWNVLKLSMPIAGRFGLAVCALSASAVGNLATNKKYAPVFSNKAKDNFVKIISRTVGAGESDENAAVFLFGGVCIEQDFGDIYLLTL